MKFKKLTIFLAACVLVIACGLGISFFNNDKNDSSENTKTVNENVDEESTDDVVTSSTTDNGTKVTKKKNLSTKTTDTTATLKNKKYHVLTINGKEYVFSDDIDTYLVMGTDLSGNEDCDNSNGYGSSYRGSMADYLCLVVVDHTSKSYSRIEINRDTISDVDVYYSDSDKYAYTQEMQICCAHWYGTNKVKSCQNECVAVSNLLGGVEVNNYLAIPMKNIGKLNNAVGGVTLTVNGDFSRTNSTLKDKNGQTITLTDQEAFDYCHERMNADDGANPSRMNRQRQYLNAFIEIAKNKTKNNLSFGVTLYDTLKDTCTSNLNVSTVKNLMNIMNTYKDNGVVSISGTQKVGQSLADDKEHYEFYVDKSSIVSGWEKILDLKKNF